MTSVTIAPAIFNDVGEIYSMLNSNEETLKRSEEEIVENINNFWVLKNEKGNIIGCIAFEPYTDRIAELRSLYVKPEYRERGYGKMLVTKALSRKKTGQHVLVVTNIPEFFQLFEFRQYEKTCLFLS